jgi:hypothetical protein
MILNKNLFKINLLTPGLGYEKSVSKKTTIALDVNLSLGFMANSDNFKIITTPYLKGQYRYYYNLAKRVEKGKDISNNSGGFIALHSSYYLEPLSKNKNIISNLDDLTVGAGWGFQKTYSSNINISTNAGLGYNLSNENANNILPILNLTIGWVIFK